MATIDADLIAPARRLLAGADGVNATAPTRRLLAGADGADITSPARTISISNASYSIDASLLSSPRTTEATIIVGSSIAADITSPARTVEFTLNSDIDLLFPAKTIIAEVVSGSVMSMDATAPARTVSSDLRTDGLISTSLQYSARTLSAQVSSGAVLSFAGQRRAPRADISISTGTVLTSEILLPTRTLSADIFVQSFIDAALARPTVFIDADIYVAITEAFRTWVLNTRKQALTEYTNFPFNSFTSFKGRTLAAGPNGIFELGAQDNDAGTSIAASVITAETDFGSSFNKRVPRLYVGYKATGDMEFHTVTSQDGTRKYLLASNGITGIQQRRVPIGRGPKSRYWQFGMVNRDGSDFLLESMMVYPENNRRRII